MQILPFSSSCPLFNEVAVAVRAARSACPQVLRHFHKENQIEFKKGLEPVTLADKECHHIVTAELQKAFPMDSILSEEATDNFDRLNQKRVWIVDPVDGTKEFIEGILEFVIMVGLSIDGYPSLGILLQPGSGRLYIGVPGHGSYRVAHGNITELKVSERTRIQEMRVALSRRHMTPFMEEIVNKVGFGTGIRMGSAGLKAALVAEQRADCYLFASQGMKEWDMCAPAALLLGAGARVTDCWGSPMKFNQEDVRLPRGFVTSNGTQHDHIVEIVRSRCDALGIQSSQGFLPFSK